MSQTTNSKKTLFLGMSSFQVGILLILGVFACGVIGLLGVYVFNSTSENGISSVYFINPSGALVGKWEVVSGTSIGTLYEFFPDGTVTVSGMVQIATKYSFPDKTHIKIEAGSFAPVYQYSLSGDELTLTNDSSIFTLKKYTELNLNSQVIEGTWLRSFSDKSECFKGLGIEHTPLEMTFGEDGTFSLYETGHYNYLMNGEYTIIGNSLHITTSGTHEASSGLGIIAGTPKQEQEQVQAQGTFDCIITISNSRLNFKDALGKNTLFHRAGN